MILLRLHSILHNLNLMPPLTLEQWITTFHTVEESQVEVESLMETVLLEEAIDLADVILDILNHLLESTHIYSQLANRAFTFTAIYQVGVKLSVMMNIKSDGIIESFVFSKDTIEFSTQRFTGYGENGLIAFTFADIQLTLPFSALLGPADDGGQYTFRASAMYLKHLGDYQSVVHNILVNSQTISLVVGANLPLNGQASVQFTARNVKRTFPLVRQLNVPVGIRSSTPGGTMNVSSFIPTVHILPASAIISVYTPS